MGVGEECRCGRWHEAITYYNIPYSLKFSRIKYFAVWLNSAQKQIFTDKNFARELCKATPTTLWIVAQWDMEAYL